MICTVHLYLTDVVENWIWLFFVVFIPALYPSIWSTTDYAFTDVLPRDKWTARVVQEFIFFVASPPGVLIDFRCWCYQEPSCWEERQIQIPGHVYWWQIELWLQDRGFTGRDITYYLYYISSATLLSISALWFSFFSTTSRSNSFELAVNGKQNKSSLNESIFFCVDEWKRTFYDPVTSCVICYLLPNLIGWILCVKKLLGNVDVSCER